MNKLRYPIIKRKKIVIKETSLKKNETIQLANTFRTF